MSGPTRDELEHAADAFAGKVDQQQATIRRLAAALKGTLTSFEAYVYLKEPPADPDEYDIGMMEVWEEARAALREAGEYEREAQ